MFEWYVRGFDKNKYLKIIVNFVVLLFNIFVLKV